MSTLDPRISLHLIGHATITQTIDTYSNVMAGIDNVAANALGEALR